MATGGNDDVYQVGVQLDLSGALPGIQSFNMLINQTNNQTNTLNQNLKISSQSGQSLFGQLSSIAGAAAGIGVLVGMVRNLSAAFAEGNKEADKLGAATSKWQKSIQELQGAKGVPGAIDPKLMREQADLMRLGMTPTQAMTSARTFAGEAAEMVATAPAGDQRKAMEARYSQFQKKLAEYALAMGANPDEIMKLGGRIFTMSKGQQTPDQMLETTANAFRMIGYAPGSTSQLAPQLSNYLVQNVDPSGRGNIDSVRKASALIAGVAMGTSVGRTGTATDQVTNAQMGLGRDKAFGAYAKSIPGYKPGMDMYDQMMLVAGQARKDLKMDDAAMAEAAKELDTTDDENLSGKGMRIREYFVSKGLRNVAPLRGMAAITANLPRIERIMAEKPLEIGDINEGIQKYKEQPYVMENMATGAATAEKLEAGERYQMMRTMGIRAQAELTRRGIDTPEMEGPDALHDMLSGKALTGQPGIAQRRLQAQTIQEAIKATGSFFQHPALEDRETPGVFTEQEASQAFRDQTINFAITDAFDRMKRNKGVPGPNVGARAQMPSEDTALDAPTTQEQLGGGLMGLVGLGQYKDVKVLDLLDRIAGNTSNSLPIPANPAEQRR
jgi:hypothetical protein